MENKNVLFTEDLDCELEELLKENGKILPIKRITAILKLKQEISCDVWESGVELVLASYFLQYATDDFNSGITLDFEYKKPFLDYKRYSKFLMKDYKPIKFDGVLYYWRTV